MANGFGSSLGRTFIFGDSAPSFATVNAQQQAPVFDDVVGEAVEGLQQVEGLTREYYVQWINAKNFAKNAWKRYGIDVTNPNPESEEEIRLSQMFQKNIANIKTLGNSLQRGRENEVAIRNRALIDPNVMATGQFGQPTGAGDFAQTGLTSEDNIIARRVGRSVSSVDERNVLNQDRDNYISGLLSELEVTEDPNQRLALSERINALRNVSATYDPTQDRNRFARLRAQRERRADNIDVANDQWVQLKRDALGGGSQILEQLQSINNVLSANYITKRDRDGNLQPFVQVTMDEPGAKADKIIDININDDSEGYRTYLGILKNSPSFEDLNVDDATLPSDLRFPATGQEFLNSVNQIKDLLQTEQRGVVGRIFRGSRPEIEVVENQLNNSLQFALQRGLVIPGTKKSTEGARVSAARFFTGSRTGDPFLELTYDDNGEDETEDFKLTGQFLEDFMRLNSFSLATNGQELPQEPQQNQVSEDLISAYQQRYPNRSREEIIAAIQRTQ